MIRKYFKDAGFLAFAEGLLQVRGLVLMPFITRQFGPVEYGVWAQVAVLISTVTPLVVLGTDAGMTRYVPGKERPQQRRDFTAWLLFLLGMSGFFAMLLLLLGGALSSVFFGESGQEYLPFIPLAALWMISSTVVNALRNWFRIQNDARWFAGSNLLLALFNILAVVLMLVRNEGVYQLVIYSLASDVLLILCLATVNSIKYGWSRPDFHILPKILKFGLPLVPSGFAIWGLNYLDRIFIVQYSTLTELGIYTVAYRVAYQVIPLLIKPWRAMYANSAAELYNLRQHDTLQRLFNRSAGLTFALVTPAIVGLFILGGPLLSLLATEEFASGASLLVFVASGYAFLELSSYYETALGLVHKQYLSTLLTTVAFIVNLVLNLVLIPRYGILGAALATFSAFLGMLLLSHYYAGRYTTLKTDYIFIGKIMAATGGMFAALLPVRWFIANMATIPQVLLLTTAGIAIYALFLWGFGVLNGKEVKLAISLIRR